jgi:energy-coupling factor transporter ATP-binding protein EcfA2
VDSRNSQSLSPPRYAARRAPDRGPSGSGKTSLLNMLAGQVAASSKVKLSGERVRTAPASRPRPRVAVPTPTAPDRRRAAPPSAHPTPARPLEAPPSPNPTDSPTPSNAPDALPQGRITVNGLDATAANHRQAYVEQNDQFYSMLTGGWGKGNGLANLSTCRFPNLLQYLWVGQFRLQAHGFRRVPASFVSPPLPPPPSRPRQSTRRWAPPRRCSCRRTS